MWARWSARSPDLLMALARFKKGHQVGAPSSDCASTKREALNPLAPLEASEARGGLGSIRGGSPSRACAGVSIKRIWRQGDGLTASATVTRLRRVRTASLAARGS